METSDVSYNLHFLGKSHDYGISLKIDCVLLIAYAALSPIVILMLGEINFLIMQALLVYLEQES